MSDESQLSEPLIPSDDCLQEHIYLISKGVRPMALVGSCEAEPTIMLRAATLIETAAALQRVIPFVIDRGDGFADFGYASHQWVIELFEWAISEGCPRNKTHQIIGMLLGYSSSEIEAHTRRDGRRFDASSATALLDESAPT